METASSDTFDAVDVLVVGCGAAGLTLALQLPEHLSVLVVSKGTSAAGSTYLAQGGISAVLDATDSVDSHMRDTLAAGDGLCHPGAVRFTVENGRTAVEWLMRLGVAFTRRHPQDSDSPLHLTREGGHSHRRVVHAADATGRAIHETLEKHARARRNVRILERHVAVDLITAQRVGLPGGNRVLGTYFLDMDKGHVRPIAAADVVVASGGASKTYLYSTNPDASTGDGIAMAWRAGCRAGNMEFMQFHPTCLYHPSARNFLISEAVRGEGGILRLPDGSRFMERFHADMELAPRDVVARAIDHEMKRLGIPCVYLDISHRSGEFIQEHFPNINARCLELGLDMAHTPLPVVPAAHYTCGGVWTDRRGRTDLSGLYCVGEAAFTGLHGANRMASNSLLECLVYATSAARDIAQRKGRADRVVPLPAWDESRVTDSDEEVVVSHNWDELRRFMWDYVGIVRSDKRLQRARRRIDLLRAEIDEYYGNFRISSDLVELRNLSLVADLIVRSAMQRKESRGLHFNIDHQDHDPPNSPRDTVLEPPGYAESGDLPGSSWD